MHRQHPPCVVFTLRTDTNPAQRSTRTFLESSQPGDDAPSSALESPISTPDEFPSGGFSSVPPVAHEPQSDSDSERMAHSVRQLCASFERGQARNIEAAMTQATADGVLRAIREALMFTQRGANPGARSDDTVSWFECMATVVCGSWEGISAAVVCFASNVDTENTRRESALALARTRPTKQVDPGRQLNRAWWLLLTVVAPLLDEKLSLVMVVDDSGDESEGDGGGGCCACCVGLLTCGAAAKAAPPPPRRGRRRPHQVLDFGAAPSEAAPDKAVAMSPSHASPVPAAAADGMDGSLPQQSQAQMRLELRKKVAVALRRPERRAASPTSAAPGGPPPPAAAAAPSPADDGMLLTAADVLRAGTRVQSESLGGLQRIAAMEHVVNIDDGEEEEAADSSFAAADVDGDMKPAVPFPTTEAGEEEDAAVENLKAAEDQKKKPSDADEKAKAKKKKKDDEEDIDQPFADLETAVKYLGSLLSAALVSPKSCIGVVPCVLRAIFAILAAVIVTIAVVLPTFFAVLAVRMTKVEVSKESFVRRAAVIAAETVAQHTARFGRLALRALPLLLLLLVLPSVVVLAVVPALDDRDSKGLTLRIFGSVFCGIITVLQVQGTVRAAMTFNASEDARLRSRTAAARFVQRWWRVQRLRRVYRIYLAIERVCKARVLSRAPPREGSDVASARVLWCEPMPARSRGLDDDHEFPPLDSLPLPSLPKFSPPSSSWLRNAGVYASVVIEAVQLTLFGVQFLLIAPDTTFNVGDVDLIDTVIPYAFASFPDPSMIRPWVAAGVVGTVVLLITGQLLVEVVQYHKRGEAAGGNAKARSDAESDFFHGFVGSILYGHGNPKNVSPVLCTTVQVLCDLLFFTVLGSLGAAFGCFESGEAVIVGTDVACFSDAHLRAVVVTLTSFGYYVPLSILVAPALAEANKPAGGEAVSVAKPFTMAVNAMKAVAILMTVFSSMRMWVGVAAGMALSIGVTLMSVLWVARTKARGPSSSRVLNVNRTTAAAGALGGSIVALVAATPSGMGSVVLYSVLAGILAVDSLCSAVTAVALR